MKLSRDTAIVLAVLVIILVLAAFRHSINGFTVLALVALVPSVILHEVSHGYVAYIFGDDTAKRARRLSLNPLVHIDIVGTLILPAVLLLIGFTPFGYAKPVPVNVAKLHKPRNQAVIVALVGPLVNIVLSIIAGILLRSALTTSSIGLLLNSSSSAVSNLWIQFLLYLGSINVLLAVFNLIPIPPLDGSAVIERLLPASMWQQYLYVRRFALPVLLFILLLAPSAVFAVMSPVIQLWERIFIP